MTERNTMWDTGLHVMRTNIINKRIIAIRLRRFKNWTRVTCTIEAVRDDWDIREKIRYKETFEVYDNKSEYEFRIGTIWAMAEKELSLDEVKG